MAILLDDVKLVAELAVLESDINKRLHHGVTYLHLTACRSLECSKILVGLGADVNAKDNDGHTPLFPASYEGRADCIKFLVENNADVNIVEKSTGCTALYHAVRGCHLGSVKLLVEARAEINRRSWQFNTPLQEAMIYDDLKSGCPKYLMSVGADVACVSPPILRKWKEIQRNK